MNYSDNIKRGDIYFVDFGFKTGSEQGGVRPCVVVQNDIGNKFSNTVIVCPITSNVFKKKLPTHVLIKRGETTGLYKDSLALVEQVLTIDKTRLKNYLGRIEPHTFMLINRAIQISLGLQESNRIDVEIDKQLIKIKEIEITLSNIIGVTNDSTTIKYFMSIRENLLNALEGFCKSNNRNYREYYNSYKLA